MNYKIRESDNYGSGHFGARRGGRIHRGVDIVAQAGAPWKSLNSGKVTKLGFAYSDDLSYRYIEVTDEHGHKFRYFYVKALPTLEVGHAVASGDIIGHVQSLQKRYPGITEHVHFEVKDARESYFNPLPFLEA